MSVKVNDGEVLVRFDDGGSIEVREFDVHCPYAGDLQEGGTRTFDDHCTATRRGRKGCLD